MVVNLVLVFFSVSFRFGTIVLWCPSATVEIVPGTIPRMGVLTTSLAWSSLDWRSLLSRVRVRWGCTVVAGCQLAEGGILLNRRPPDGGVFPFPSEWLRGNTDFRHYFIRLSFRLDIKMDISILFCSMHRIFVIRFYISGYLGFLLIFRGGM